MMEGSKNIEFLSIPISWDSYLLGSEDPKILNIIRNGLTIKQNKEVGKYKITRIETISQESIDENKVRYTDDIPIDKLDKYLIKKGDILFSHINSDPHLGKTGIAQKDYNDLIHGMNLLLFRANPNVIEPEFLNYIFKIYRQIGVFLKIRSRAVNQSSINQNKLKNLQIPLPPLPEQRKIAYVLSMVQKAIEQQDKLTRTTTELKKALMQKLFTEGLHGEKQKQTEIGLVPESWEVVELNQVAEKPQYGFTDSASNTGNAKFLRITDITEFGVNWDSVPYCNCPNIEKYKLINGDIVFARIGATTGKSYIIKNPPKSVFASYLIRLRCKSDISSQFLIYFFETQMYWNQINSRKGDNLKGGVNGSVLSRLFVPKPSLPEQKQIANILSALDNKIEFHRKKKQTLSDLFKTLLHELMTGQRRVNEIDFGLRLRSAHEPKQAHPEKKDNQKK